MRLKPLSDQVIAITGASSGIGLLAARLAAERGARVMLIARNEEALRQIVADIAAKGGQADFAVADVGDRDQLQAAMDKTLKTFGRLDTWVSNAGVAIYADLLDTPAEEHERLFRTNYFGCVNSAEVAMRHLSARGGAFIAVASIVSDMPSPFMGAYAASKHAVASFVRSLRIEARAGGVPVSITLVKPSGMASPISHHAANHRDGRPRVPPPAYDPVLVAEAILDAARTPTREVTVGGIGRLEILFAAHFPALFERIAPIVGPLLQDRSKPPATSNNLFEPTAGSERSPDEHGRRFSLYAFANRHPIVTGALLAGLAGLGGARRLGRRRDRRMPSAPS